MVLDGLLVGGYLMKPCWLDSCTLFSAYFFFSFFSYVFMLLSLVTLDFDVGFFCCSCGCCRFERMFVILVSVG